MKRPFGVTLSAIILLLGSSFQILMALGMALSGAIMPAQNSVGVAGSPSSAVPMPSWIPLMMYFIGTVLAGFAIWGIVTAIGLFRLRRWARYSILIIGGLVAFFGLVSMLSMLAATMVSLTPLPGASPSPLAPDQAHSVQVMTKVIFVVLALMYGGICSIGVWWLVYFNRKTAR